MKLYDEKNNNLKIYSANPWFNPEQMERSNYIRDMLKNYGYSVYDPKSANLVSSDDNADKRKLAFENNLEAINEADIVFAVTDGKDMGVCFECGYAYSKNIPIVYFAETLGNNKFNLMLAQSGRLVISSRSELEKVLNDNILEKVSEGEYFNYVGDVE